MLQTPTGSQTEKKWPLPLPASALDHLAARFRAEGLFLLALKPDGTIAYHDANIGLFFGRYVLPQLQYPDSSQGSLSERAALLMPASGVTIWPMQPGVHVAAIPLVEKRHIVGILALAAKADSFKLSEDVQRVCSQLGLDGVWLVRQADELPVYDDAALPRQVRLLAAMARDQGRNGGLEQELDSLSQQLANTYEELSLIYQVSSGMRINRRAPDFFKQACLDVLEVLSVKGMGVALCGDTKYRQEPVLYGQLSLPPGSVHRLADDLMAVLRERKCPILINDLSRDKHFRWLADNAHQLIAVPLQRQEQVLGCLFGIDKTSGEFDSIDSKLLNSIANESAIYLENVMLFDDVRDLMMGMLHSLTAAVDAKDTYTCGHSERVALLSRHLAQQVKLSDQQVERIYMAGLLHDVGKIGVPESVLQKTGRLAPEEFEQMKKHPAIGARILSDIKQVQDIVPGVLHHHERFDGKGYPSGLSGTNIPLMGRIICLADCFDAMTSNRTYRKALPLEVAMTEIRRCSGTQFDPALTEAFLRINMDQFRALLREHQQAAKKVLDLENI